MSDPPTRSKDSLRVSERLVDRLGRIEENVEKNSDNRKLMKFIGGLLVMLYGGVGGVTNCAYQEWEDLSDQVDSQSDLLDRYGERLGQRDKELKLIENRANALEVEAKENRERLRSLERWRRRAYRK